MADPASFDWDAHFAQVGETPAASPSPGASVDWDQHFASVPSPLDAAQAKSAPKQANGPLREPLLAAKDFGEGVANLVTMPGNVLKAVFGPASDSHKDLTVVSPRFPTSEDIAPITNALGITGTPQLQDTSPGERYMGAGLRALPVAAAGTAMGIPPGASLATTEASAEASELTHQLAPTSVVLPTLAGLGVGIGAQGIVSALAGNVVEKTAASLGDSRTLQQAGEAMQDAARNWRNEIMPAKLKTVSAPLDTAVPGDAPVSLDNYTATLKGATSRAGALQSSADVLTPKGAQWLQKALNAKKDLDELAGGVSSATWKDARELRSVLGEAASDPGIVKDVGEKNLAALYKALSADLRGTAVAHGAGELWDAFNDESSRLYQYASGPLSKIISSTSEKTEGLKPEDVAARALAAGKKGATDLEAYNRETPQITQELAAAHLRSAKPWTVLSPEAKVAMVPDLGTRKALDAAVPLKTANGASTNWLSSQALQSMAGVVGGDVGAKLLHLGGIGGATAQTLAEAIGFAAPLLASGAKSMARNPSLLAYPALGTAAALGGQAQDNSLSLPPPGGK